MAGQRDSVITTSNTPKKPRKPKGPASLMDAIKTPLGFYVLALLIVESTLAIVLWRSNLSEEHVWEGFRLMIWILAAVLVIVTIFAVFNPRSLLYGKEEHREPLLEPSALKGQIEELIRANVKSECLKSPDK
jgi:heme/copper-type cytochrome/quinol oxidase subunit 2